MPPSIKRYNLRQIFHPHIPKLQAHQFEGDETIPLVDLRHKMPPVYDQGDLGSCSANVLCAIYACDNPSLLGSRLFIYYNERSLHGSVSDDSGACLSDGIQALHTSGLCPETMWSYVDDKMRSTAFYSRTVESDIQNIS
ncbi:hypothetical protein CEUSTIGMA_g11618.t1 [Chlamydomonas eustigma]|uniref:Peptidase C1A papain C-terminal domain-containing protein n=1 Tax=Chlamydomonas eustigma TaxID=1157962 RepID=A0A250XM68_9CHLO|nr:hypothetical protein CEUSTIGMA_g11618.t1 [Chlamydomonas eustigma]|eukprot:GAX84195.1 hypothetical protein CEUSTIGMA_g11618.t1 [Chlamydomonas eustigma]